MQKFLYKAFYFVPNSLFGSQFAYFHHRIHHLFPRKLDKTTVLLNQITSIEIDNSDLMTKATKKSIEGIKKI